MSDPVRTKRPRLESAEELKRTASKKRTSHSRWLTIVILIFVVALLVGVYFISQSLKANDENVTEEIVSGATSTPINYLLNHTNADVSSFTVRQRDADPFTIHVAENGDFTVDGKPEFVPDKNALYNMQHYAASVINSDDVETDAKDLALYGLENPACIVDITYTDGTQATLMLGNKMPTSETYYTCLGGTRDVCLTYNMVYNAFTTPLTELYDLPSPFKLTTDEPFIDMLFEQKGRETVEIGYPESDVGNVSVSTLRMLQPFFYEANADRTPIIYESAISLKLEGYAGTVSELPGCGLSPEEEALAHVCITGQSGTVVEYWVGNFANEDSRYIRIDDSGAVYLVSSASLEYLEQVVPSYLVSQFSNLVNIATVDSVTVTHGEDCYVLSLTRDTDTDGNTVTSYFFNGEPAKDRAFKTLYQSVIGLMCSKISDDFALQGDLLVRTEYQFNNGMENLIIDYQAYDDQYCSVLRDGQTIFLMKLENLQGMLNDLAAFTPGL